MVPKKGRFTFESEIGFQYFSAPTVQYNFSRNRMPELPLLGAYLKLRPHPPPPTVANIITEQNNLQNDLYDLRFFPIISFGLSYKIH